MKTINYGRQFIDDRDFNLIKKSLGEEKITTGKFVNLFEKNLRKYLGCKFIKVCNSGTAAIHLAYEAAGLKKGSNIIMPSINFISAYRNAKLMGLNVYIADVDKYSGQMSPKNVLDLIKFHKLKKIDAILNMYLGGYPENIIDFYKLKTKYNCILIEDACHAFGASYKYKNKNYKIGSCKHSDISTFSFHPLKTITTGEGGAICTNNKKMFTKMKNLLSHGIVRHKNYWDYDIPKLGMNYRLSDINSALGITQLKKINQILKKRNEIYNFYSKHLKSFTKFIHINRYSKNLKHSFHLYVVHFKIENFKCDKDRLLNFFKKNNINLQQHYIPIYKFKILKSRSLPNSEKYYRTSVSLPIHVNLTNKELFYIISVLKKCINRFSKKNV